MKASRRALERSLLDASAALAHGDLQTLAELLRHAWRGTRNPTLADLYERLVSPTHTERLSGHDAASRALSFRHSSEQRPGDPYLLPLLLAEPWNHALPEAERLRLLEPWTPDPLLAGYLARRLRLPLTPPWERGGSEHYTTTMRLLFAQRDPRQLGTLELLDREPGLGGDQRRQLRGALSSLEALGFVRLDQRARAALAPLERRARVKRDAACRGAQLLAAIYADPDADETRLVYADWLTEQGDPLGEFITLQLQARTRQRGQVDARQRALITRCARDWAGSLHGILNPRTRRFERGFLSAASIEADELHGEIIEAREWSTLRSLDGHVPDLLALRGQLDHLRQLYGFLSLERFMALRAAGRLQAVTHYECSIADPNLSFDTPLGLRSLLIRSALDHQIRALLAAPACAGLEEFAVYYLDGNQDWAGDHRERVQLRPRFELIRSHLPAHIHQLRMIDDRSSRASSPEGCELLIRRDGAGHLSELLVHVHPYADQAPFRSLESLRHVLTDFAQVGLTRVSLGQVVPAEVRDHARASLEDYAQRETIACFDVDPSAEPKPE